MNASCALQHFCDIHGAQILLCTDTRNYIQNADDNDDTELNTFYSQYIKSENPRGQVECKSCTLSPDNILVSTIDLINQMVYISSPSTPNQQLYKNMREACLRSINVEKSVEVDSPILFGDDENGYRLSLAFSCKDFHARGTQRLYSLCYLCQDKYRLVSIMKLLGDCFRQIVYWLQYEANENFEQEGRIKVNTNPNRIATTTYVCRPLPLTPTPRMLSEVVQDSKLIYRIHALFVWLLRTTNSAINESLFDALPTEEQTTEQERKDTLDNDLILPRCRTRTITPHTLDSSTMSPTLTNSRNLSYLASSLYSTSNGGYHQNGNGFGNHHVNLNSEEYQFTSYGHDALKLFQLFIKKLNNTKYLQYILYNWLTGNRLIIKYTNRIDNQDILYALISVFRFLLPDGCCHIIEASNQITSCTANLILVDTDILLENDMLLSLIEKPQENNSIVLRIIFDDIDDNLRVVKLETIPPLKFDTPIPRYAKIILDFFMENQINEDVFQSIITQHKIKYLNKAKLYFQFGRCQQVATTLSNERQQMKIFNIENSSDLELIRFWQKGLSQAYRTQIRLLKQDLNNH